MRGVGPWVVAFMLAAPAVGLAQENGDGWLRVRASAGLTPEVLGVSAVLRAADPIELEAGLGLGGWFVRGGFAMRLNPGSKGSTHFELVPTLGYAKFWEIEFLSLRSVPRDVPHGLLGIGVVTWVGPHVGLEGRLNVGVAFAQDYERDDGTVDHGGVFPIVSLAGGVAF